MVELMMKRKLPWFAVVALVAPLAIPLPGYSAELNLQFNEPGGFSDIEPAREHRDRFHERTLEGLEQIFSELAQTLPADQVLHITVTDVNLAGYVDHAQRGGALEPVRVVRHGHAPSLKLEYSLLDAEGNTLQEGEEHLRGRGMVEQLGQTNHNALSYERQMITRWFERNFEAS